MKLLISVTITVNNPPDTSKPDKPYKMRALQSHTFSLESIEHKMTVWDGFQCIIFMFVIRIIFISVMNMFMNVLTSLMSLCCSFPAVKLCSTDCLYSLVLCSTSCTRQSFTHLEVYLCVWLTARGGGGLLVWNVGMQVSADSEWCTTCQCGKIALLLACESSHDFHSYRRQMFTLGTNCHTKTHTLHHTLLMTGLVFIFTWCSGTVLFW